jgi:tRNA(fMet)-specific endonuclease VapC
VACLDTTLLVDLMRRRSELRARAFQKLQQLLRRDELLVTTRLNMAELYVGVERSDNPEREEQVVREALRGLGILDFDQRAARLFGRVSAYLQRIGRPAGDMDVLIAATCLGAGHCLVTRDASHFQNIPELAVETY